jgi:Tfp pilus assembly protein PilX
MTIGEISILGNIVLFIILWIIVIITILNLVVLYLLFTRINKLIKSNNKTLNILNK